MVLTARVYNLDSNKLSLALLDKSTGKVYSLVHTALAYSHEFGHVLDDVRLIIMYSCSIAGISVKNDVVINL